MGFYENMKVFPHTWSLLHPGVLVFCVVAVFLFCKGLSLWEPSSQNYSTILLMIWTPNAAGLQADLLFYTVPPRFCCSACYERREPSLEFAFGGEMSCVVAVGRNKRRPLLFMGFWMWRENQFDSIKCVVVNYFQLLDISIMRINTMPNIQYLYRNIHI